MAGNIARLGRRRHSIGFPAQPNDEIGRVFARFWLSNMQFIFKSNDVLDILGFLEMNSIVGNGLCDLTITVATPGRDTFNEGRP